MTAHPIQCQNDSVVITAVKHLADSQPLFNAVEKVTESSRPQAPNILDQ